MTGITGVKTGVWGAGVTGGKDGKRIAVGDGCGAAALVAIGGVGGIFMAPSATGTTGGVGGAMKFA